VTAVSLGGCAPTIRPDDTVKDAATAAALANEKCPKHWTRFVPSDAKLEGEEWHLLKLRYPMIAQVAIIENRSGEVTACGENDIPEDSLWPM